MLLVLRFVKIPKSENLTFVFHEINDQRFQSGIAKLGHVFGVGLGRMFFHVLQKRIQENFSILNVSHHALIFMHILEIPARKILNERMDHLNQIAEFFERQPQAVDAGSLQRIHLTVGLLG